MAMSPVDQLKSYARETAVNATRNTPMQAVDGWIKNESE